MRKRRASAKAYNKMVKRLAALKRQGKIGAWARHIGRASAYRKRMISLNRIHPVDYLPTPQYSRDLHRKMPLKYRRLFDEMFRSGRGRKTLQRYRKFWKLPYPTAIQTIPDGPKDSGRKIPLVGMGYAPEVHISLSREGTAGERVKIRGKWWVACDPVGRKIYLLTGKKPKLPLTGNTRKLPALGYAPETHYIPTPDMEKAGTHKAKLHWVHLHSDDSGINPVIRADVSAAKARKVGKTLSRARSLRQKLKALGIGRKTNFVYDRATYTITDWIRR